MAQFAPLNRCRAVLRSGGGVSRVVGFVVLSLVFGGGFVSARAWAAAVAMQKDHHLSKIDIDLLDDISRRSFRYFWQKQDPHTGLILDRARFDGRPGDIPEHRNVASIAATGFGLTAFAIAAQHRWISPAVARKRILTTLRFFAYHAQQKHGWFYHFLDAKTGKRRWKCEVSSMDTALLLAGVLTVREAFSDDPEIVRLGTLIYDRVDFPWMLNGSRLFLSHGWTPEAGFLPYRWDTYSEAKILYVLAIGSPTHPISPDAWYSWRLPVVGSGENAYIGGGPLFIQQYSQAWLDLRDRSYSQTLPVDRFVPRVNYFVNSVMATRAQQALAVDLSRKFRGYSAKVWGITASDSPNGYVDWGASSHDSRINGTVVPSAAAGSLMFAPDICIPALRAMLLNFGRKIYGPYGFADAFNPTTGWVSRYVIGIDVGITLLSAENLRRQDVWHWFMSDPNVERALDMVGLVPNSPAAAPQKGARLAEAGKGISGLKTPKPSLKGEFPQEIPLTHHQKIPAAGYKYKIPIPPSQTK